MQHVVYVLGAGFSAPLGIPVVRDFLMKAKDLFFSDRGRYAHFGTVLDAIRSLDAVKNYVHADLFDIEEVFSIIEMQRQLGSEVPDFGQFISDVVVGSTPPLPRPAPTAAWRFAPWGNSDTWRPYGEFALQLIRQKLEGPSQFSPIGDEVRYDVISLNYDRAIEIPLDQLGWFAPSLGPPLYSRPGAAVVPATVASNRLRIMKLHGDAVSGTVVPPTWGKSVKPGIKQDWQEAYDVLAQANHVRVVGYSFPPTDTYFRYFLMAALSRTTHLKSLDVLTMDPGEQTQRRCESLFSFKFMRFRNMRTESYFDALMARDDLERAHASLFP